MLSPLFWLLVATGVVAAVLNSPAVKGWFGEQRVRKLIRSRLDPSVYREFYNVTVKAERGTTQIDHVYVSPFGVFVIETKNMSHWIHGRRHDHDWIQNVYGKRFPFPNPIWQNLAHIKALGTLLDLPRDKFRSVVVFVGDCTLKSEMPPEVCTSRDLIEYIRSFDRQVLSAIEVGALCRKLEEVRLAPTFKTHSEHVADLRRRHGEREPSGGVIGVDAGSLMQAGANVLLETATREVGRRGRRFAGQAVGATLGVGLIKAVLAILVIAFIWSFWTKRLGDASRSFQSPKPVAASPQPQLQLQPQPTRAVAPQVSHGPSRAYQAPAPLYYHPTGSEAAEQKRRADEAMRVLAPNTKEIPLALPTAAE